MKSAEYPIDLILVTLLCAALLILCGTILRKLFPVLEKMHLPASVIGGGLGLLIGPQLLGGMAFGGTSIEGMITDVYAIGKKLPGYLIVVVFAALMMGKTIPSPKKIWSDASPNLVIGYGLAWGQYVVGILLAMLVLVPFFDANMLSSALIAIGFQGGYGTAAGLGETYSELGFEEGYDLALGMATAGKVSAILVGLALINFAVKRDQMQSPDEKRKEDTEAAVPEKAAKALYENHREEKYFSADTLILHFSLLCVAIVIGWLLKHALLVVEGLIVSDPSNGVMQYIPLFPLALIGGIILQLFISRINKADMINAHHLHSISHSFLDLLIVVAIATLSLKTLAANWEMLCLLIATGIGWNLFIFFFVAPRLYKNAPWTRGLGDFAHSTGATTTGLLLMKIVDPNDKTGARSSFSLKQPLYEPIIGGGFVTALALPLIHAIGLWGALILFSSLLLLVIYAGFRTLNVKANNPILNA